MYSILYLNLLGLFVVLVCLSWFISKFFSWIYSCVFLYCVYVVHFWYIFLYCPWLYILDVFLMHLLINANTYFYNFNKVCKFTVFLFAPHLPPQISCVFNLCLIYTQWLSCERVFPHLNLRSTKWLYMLVLGGTGELRCGAGGQTPS